MESSDYTGGFEDFLQDKADQYKLYPADRVWNAINAKLHPRTKWSYFVVAALFIGLGIGGKVHDTRFALERETALNMLQAPDGDDTPVIQIASAEKTSRKRTNQTSVTASAGSTAFARVVPMFRDETMPRDGETSDAEATGLTVTEDDTAPLEIATVIENPGKPVEEVETVNDPVGDVKETASEELEPFNEPNPRGETSSVRSEIAALQTAKPALSAKDIAAFDLPAPAKASAIKVLKPRFVKVGWQVYLSPTVSYRKLSGEGMRFYSPTGTGAYYTPDVNKSVTHKPDVGFEIGTALTFTTSKRLRFKTGVQLNMNQYDVQAYNFTPELAPMTRGGIGHTTINTVSRFRNYNGFSKTWLKNQHIMLALPVGAEYAVLGRDKVQLIVAGTVQPTYVVNNQAYMISTNMKNYAQEPSLYRRFNVAAGAEAYLQIKSGSYKWMIGPQFRYQILSSYKQAYPINEHLTDYGFKLGISR